MPFTPFHFGPNASIIISLHKYLDVPVFLFVNIIIDCEAFLVIIFGLNYPLHGYCHTFLIGSFLGILCGLVAYFARNIFQLFMNSLHFPYKPNFYKMISSGGLGACFHILLNAPLYSDIKPFFSFDFNPIFGIISSSIIYLICATY
ncbi:MAG: hydrolase [Promethearchaeota archaeon]